MKNFRLSSIAVMLATSLPTWAPSALAQQQPDAGRTLQQQRPAPQPPQAAGSTVNVQTPATAPTAAGGPKVTVESITISGNSVFSEDQLLQVLGDYAGKSYDLAGLRGLTEAIANRYREAGYPFARAFLPQQAGTQGRLRIEVLEGRYGAVQALGDEALTGPASKFLGILSPGSVINGKLLERTTLILDDQPGIKIAPIIRPGRELGSGDLDVRIDRRPGFSGDVGLDNHGNRFTGEHRVRANFQWDSPFTFGDQASLRLLYSDEGMWLGSLGYSLPLGASGLRGNAGHSETYYLLSKDYSALGATGSARVSTLGLTYPLVRSQKANLNLAVTIQQKSLNDRQRSSGADDRKLSDSLPFTLSFDRRDTLWGGGVTYGSLAYTSGTLRLGLSLQGSDESSGQDTRGGFRKVNLDIARVQATRWAGLVGFARLSTQEASKNLDSSESFSLGGPSGVRAYPVGEGNGDAGWLAQVEIRYAIGAYVPYLFHDAGRVVLNAKNASLASPASPNHRAIAGHGIGLRFNQGKLNVDATVSWASQGGEALSDSVQRTPRAWMSVGSSF